MLQSIQTGQVTVATLNVLHQNETQLLHLAEVFQGNEGDNANGKMRTSGAPSFKESYFQRLDELEQLNEQKEKLQYFIMRCEQFYSGKPLYSCFNRIVKRWRLVLATNLCVQWNVSYRL